MCELKPNIICLLPLVCAVHIIVCLVIFSVLCQYFPVIYKYGLRPNKFAVSGKINLIFRLCSSQQDVPNGIVLLHPVAVHSKLNSHFSASVLPRPCINIHISKAFLCT
jgi:hypothetical protein